VFSSILRKCRRCGHRVPIESTFRATWGERTTWVCQPCYLELVEKTSGYRQGKLELDQQPLDTEVDLPF
jgi:hypothetical protein